MIWSGCHGLKELRAGWQVVVNTKKCLETEWKGQACADMFSLECIQIWQRKWVNFSLMICSIFSPQLQMKALPPLFPGVLDTPHRFYLPVSVKQLPPIRLLAGTSHSYLSLSSEILHQQLLAVLTHNWQDQWKTVYRLGSCHQIYVNLKRLSIYWHQRAQKVGMGWYCHCHIHGRFFWNLSLINSSQVFSKVLLSSSIPI